MLLLVAPKETASQSVAPSGAVDARPTLAAKLDARIVDDISTSAGVKKDFHNFSSMMYNALIGKSASVSFFVENCDEMKARLRSNGHNGPDSRFDDDDSSSLTVSHLHSDDDGSHNNSDHVMDHMRRSSYGGDATSEMEFLQKKYFTLDYCVDFTRAIFPVPLEHYTPEVHTLNAHVGQTTDGEQQQHDDQRNVIRRLQAENKKLKRENEALTLLSTEKMAEMQRVCEDLQRRAVNEVEYRKLKKDFAEAKKRIEMLERTNDKLQRSEVSRHPTPRRVPTPTPATAPRSANRLGRFDTPPPERGSANHRGRSPSQRSPATSRASTPPRSPRPAWGQHQATVSKRLTTSPRFVGLSTSGESQYSGTSYGGYGAHKDIVNAGRRTTSPHDRLYMMDTAASTNLRRTRDPHRALFH